VFEAATRRIEATLAAPGYRLMTRT